MILILIVMSRYKYVSLVKTLYVSPDIHYFLVLHHFSKCWTESCPTTTRLGEQMLRLTLEGSVNMILWKAWTQSSTSLQEYARPRKYPSHFTLNSPEYKTHDLVVSPYTEHTFTAITKKLLVLVSLVICRPFQKTSFNLISSIIQVWKLV